MDSIAQKNQNEKQFNTNTNYFFKFIKLGDLLNQCNFYKAKGFSPIFIFKFIFQLLFTNKNFYQHNQTKHKTFSKDVVYRFFKSTYYNWNKLLMLIAIKLISFYDGLTSNKRVKVLIFDDSPYDKSRSKNIELLSRVYDHAAHKYIKGFRMLTCVWSDGFSTIPIAFSLLSGTKKQILFEENKEINKNSNGYKYRQTAKKPAPEVVLEMIKEAIECKIKFDYVLFDTWFSSRKAILDIKCTLERNIIAMVKKGSNNLYEYNNKKYTLAKLKKLSRTRKGKERKKSGNQDILSSIIVKVTDGERETKVKIVFVQKKHGNDWLAIISTDTSISEEEIVRIYRRRWDIEVFFKACKSLLQLGKEYQIRSYDGLVGHTTIVLIRYIMLSFSVRNSEDNRTIGGLFLETTEEVRDITVCEAIQLMMDVLSEVVIEHVSKKSHLKKAEITALIDDLVNTFISRLPEYLKRILTPLITPKLLSF